jgi:hypothetical protein
MNTFVDEKNRSYTITRKYLEMPFNIKKNINKIYCYDDGGSIEFVFDDDSKFQIPETQFISNEQRGYDAVYIDNTYQKTLLRSCTYE